MASQLSSKQFDPQRLRAIRNLLGWSRMDLAIAAGLGYPTIARYENGGIPSLSNLTLLAEALGILVDELLTDGSST
jgi:transcriptional regulator with XRE-family HTH domain